MPTNTPTVWIRATDEAFERAQTMLTAGGFDVKRELPAKKNKLVVAAKDIVRRHCLTERESEVLRYALAGKTNREIAIEIEISRATVKWHMNKVFAKTDTHNREDLLRLALQL